MGSGTMQQRQDLGPSASLPHLSAIIVGGTWWTDILARAVGVLPQVCTVDGTLATHVPRLPPNADACCSVGCLLVVYTSWQSSVCGCHRLQVISRRQQRIVQGHHQCVVQHAAGGFRRRCVGPVRRRFYDGIRGGVVAAWCRTCVSCTQRVS